MNSPASPLPMPAAPPPAALAYPAALAHPAAWADDDNSSSGDDADIGNAGVQLAQFGAGAALARSRTIMGAGVPWLRRRLARFAVLAGLGGAFQTVFAAYEWRQGRIVTGLGAGGAAFWLFVVMTGLSSLFMAAWALGLAHKMRNPAAPVASGLAAMSIRVGAVWCGICVAAGTLGSIVMVATATRATMKTAQYWMWYLYMIVSFSNCSLLGWHGKRLMDEYRRVEQRMEWQVAGRAAVAA